MIAVGDAYKMIAVAGSAGVALWIGCLFEVLRQVTGISQALADVLKAGVVAGALTLDWRLVVADTMVVLAH